MVSGRVGGLDGVVVRSGRSCCEWRRSSSETRMTGGGGTGDADRSLGSALSCSRISSRIPLPSPFPSSRP